MKKINSIRFKNFKAFYGEEPIQLDAKNLLVYGENGSGKSSIFWGLYTFLQSSSKDAAGITKYFVDFDDAVPATHDSLKNIFSSNADGAFIELETIDTTTGTRTTDRIDAVNPTTDIAKNNSTIALANASSDFINYKLLHNFYNVTHKESINLWQVFSRDIFPFFRKNENAGEKYFSQRIEELTRQVPLSSGGAKQLKIGSRPQVEYVAKIDTLNNDIQIFINEIEQNANLFLKDHFFDGKEVLKLALSYHVKIDYESVKRQDKSKYSIKLDLEIWDDILKVFKRVKRPHSFLNEALLTRIAFAVRIGALQTRLQNRDYQILCLDDMLISLDMSNRDKVIQLVLNIENKVELEFFDRFQKLVFTHDKAFYNLCKQRIMLSKKEKDWIFKEIYLDTDKTPQRPFFDNSKDYFEKADKYLKSFDYPASANSIRQGLENIVFNFLQENERYTLKDGVTTSKMLGELLSSLKTILERYNQDLTLINDLFVYKDQILNPLSHDNIKTQVYKEELKRVLATIPTLKALESTRIKELRLIPTIIKLADVDNNTGLQVEYHIAILEHLYTYKLLDGNTYLSRGECEVLKCTRSDNSELILNNKYNSLRECGNRLAHFLNTTYANDQEILSHLVI
jgi:AAA domain